MIFNYFCNLYKKLKRAPEYVPMDFSYNHIVLEAIIFNGHALNEHMWRAMPCISHRFRAIIYDLNIQGRTETRVYNHKKQKGKIVNKLFDLNHGYTVRVDGCRSYCTYITEKYVFGKCGAGIVYDAYQSYFTRTYNPYGFFGDKVSFEIKITMDNNVPCVPDCTCVAADAYCHECVPECTCVAADAYCHECEHMGEYAPHKCAHNNSVDSLPCNACITYYSYDRIGYVTKITIMHTTGRQSLRWFRHKYTITFDENRKPQYSSVLYYVYRWQGGPICADATLTSMQLPSLPNRIKRLAWPTIKRYMPGENPCKN